MTRAIASGVIGLLTVPVVAITGLAPLPFGSTHLPPGILVVVALADIAAWTARGSSAGWLRYGLGLAFGTLGALSAFAAFASSMTVESWLISADVFRVQLAKTVVAITTAGGIGYVAGALSTRGLPRAVPGARGPLVAIALPVVAMAAVALGYPLIVPERALLPADAPTVTLTVRADGRLTIEPAEFRAGPAIWKINNELDRPLSVIMVAVLTDGDLERLRSGDAQGFAFDVFVAAQPGSGFRSRFDTEPARYAIFFQEGGEGQAEHFGPIPPARLVIVDVRP